ncbi:hypothetical protein NESM_000165200 [Novymonas esmeraldas]|uniref:Uncharacterized protein n=1 Tax=Novymonas esmeraldas TaxID=1808958 RepID=A0AAW0F5N3_9TRYP
MFSAKYYDDPFGDDENDICYAEIVSDGDDGGAAADARARRFSIPLSAASSTAVRRGSESAKAGDGASKETPLPAAHGSPRPSGRVGNADYEAYIEELRGELEAANAENNRLTAAQTKLESRARSLAFEKENAEWQLQQERERNHTLTERVTALEEELELVMTRASAVAHQRGAASVESSSLHVSPTPDGLRASAPRTQRRDPNAPPYPHSLAETPCESSRGHDMSRAAAPYTPTPDTSRSSRAPEQLHYQHGGYASVRNSLYEREAEPTAFHRGARAGPDAAAAAAAPPSPPGAQMSRNQLRASAAQEAMAAQQRTRREHAAIVQDLEGHLLEHSQQRDELTKQLERLERIRTRTVADRKQKAAVERGLEEEEKIIGQIRLDLRHYSAFLR